MYIIHYINAILKLFKIIPYEYVHCSLNLESNLHTDSVNIFYECTMVRDLTFLSYIFAHFHQIVERELTHAVYFLTWVNSRRMEMSKSRWEKSNSQREELHSKN